MRFLREARATSKLRHDHILPVLSYGEADNVTYIVLPVITGGTLAARLTGPGRPLALQEISEYITQVASALDFAHQQGIVHRDVKPSNILLDRRRYVYLSDFGIARLFESGGNALTREGQVTLTRTGQVLGTPYYMAPEQIRGGPMGPATHIYALGVVLYELVTGQVPFQGDTPLAIAMQHLQESPFPPRALRRDLSASMEAVMLHALAKEPGERYGSAGALAQAFERARAAAWRPLELHAWPVTVRRFSADHERQQEQQLTAYLGDEVGLPEFER
jgi:serine/threonine protein kinase